jgi:hypothetical protein
MYIFVTRGGGGQNMAYHFVLWLLIKGYWIIWKQRCTGHSFSSRVLALTLKTGNEILKIIVSVRKKLSACGRNGV